MAACHHVSAPRFVELPLSCGIPRQEVEEAIIRRELKRSLRRRRVDVAADTPTEQLALLDELSHRASLSL